MKKGIILESAVPMRSEPSDKAEMVNQLLFGEQYDVLEEKENWIRIKSIHDLYEGWIDLKQHSLSEVQIEEGSYCNAPTEIRHKLRGVIKVTPGAFLPSASQLIELNIESLSEGTNTCNLKGACSLFENAPYLWGGRTPLGIDCSGFTQLVFRLLNVHIPRDASQQIELGEQLSFIEESEEGDLAFFDNQEGKITHVGIIIKEGIDIKIIHASGRVRTDKLDHNGIFNEETQSYSHKLRIIKRIL